MNEAVHVMPWATTLAYVVGTVFVVLLIALIIGIKNNKGDKE